MMIEYQIQCRNDERYGDRWVMCNHIAYTSYEEAKADMDTIAIRAKMPRTRLYYRTPITEFRIVSRIDGKWEEVSMD